MKKKENRIEYGTEHGMELGRMYLLSQNGHKQFFRNEKSAKMEQIC